MNLLEFEKIFEQKVRQITKGEDPAHDILHFKRVVSTAKALCQQEQAQMEVVLPAAWLHDFVIIPKSDPRRSLASKISAEAAIDFLRGVHYPSIYFKEIAHAIEAHSFSANIQTQTLEANIVQDADRLDALGAIGLARCFAVAGQMKTSFYSENDPFAEARVKDDRQFTIDHFYVKLFKIAEALKTESGRAEGLQRVAVMKRYLSDLQNEIA